jgi:hypothetical protein
MLFFAVGAKYMIGARLIYRITDFYPEVLVADAGRRNILMALFQWLTWFLRRRVDLFQALGEDQRRRLAAGGISPDRIVLKRDVAPVEMTGREVPLERPNEISGYLALLYSGNYGMAHEVDTVVDGMVQHLRDGCGRFAVWLNASGTKADVVEQRLCQSGAPVARTRPVPLDRLASLLAAADVHLITLRPRFSGLVLPSKVYACIASGKPILFVGPEDSDVHLLCTRAEGLPYERVEPGDVSGFAAALDRLVRLLEGARGLGTIPR